MYRLVSFVLFRFFKWIESKLNELKQAINNICIYFIKIVSQKKKEIWARFKKKNKFVFVLEGSVAKS